MVPKIVLTATAILAMTSTDLAAASDCGFAAAFNRSDERGTKSVQIYEGKADPLIGGVKPLLFVSTLKVNTDGTRISYSIDDPRAQRVAINDLRNAMRAGATIPQVQAAAHAGWLPTTRTWQLLSSDVIERDKATGKPCSDGHGYLISMTSDVAVDGGWGRVGDCKADKWIDALSVNALVLPKGATQFSARGASNRTAVVAMTLGVHHNVALGIVGDKGPVNELGEASVAMNRTLNGLAADDLPKSNRDAIVRFQAPRSAILLFPGAANVVARPLTGAHVESATGAIFKRWGGTARLTRCLKEIPIAG